MYCYIVSKPLGEEQTETNRQILGKLESLGIAGKKLEVKDSGEVSKPIITSQITADCKTLVAIGDDATFESLLALSPKLPTSIAYGFVPTESNSQLGHHLGLKDWREAITAIRHRRLEPTNLLYFNGGVVLFEKTFSTGQKALAADSKLSFKIDQALELQAAANQISIVNRSKDEFNQGQAFGITAFSNDLTPTSSTKESILPLHHLKTAHQAESTLLFRLGANSCEVRGSLRLTDVNSKKELKLPLTIRPGQDPIRLIVKKATAKSHTGL